MIRVGNFRYNFTTPWISASFFLLTVFVSPVSRAAEKLSLEAALTKALAANPDLLVAKASVRDAAAAANSMKAQDLPLLSVQYQNSQSDDVATQLPDANNAMVMITENLFNGGQTLAEIRKLEHFEDSAKSSAQQKRLEILAAVKESFYRGLSANAQVNDWKAAQAEFSRLLKLMAPKFTVGQVPQYDYAKIRISLHSYLQEQLKATASLGHELHVLGAAMGGEPPTELSGVDEIPRPPQIDVEKVMSNIYANRPDVQAENSRILAQQEEVARARRERLPKVTLEADYGYGGLTPQDMWTLGWGTTATVSMPLFDFGGISSDVRRARARLNIEEYRDEALRLKIRTEVYDTLERVRIAWAGYKASLENLPVAKRAYASSLRRYRTALAPMTELSDAHTLLIESRLDRERALAEYQIALTQLRLVLGDEAALKKAAP